MHPGRRNFRAVWLSLFTTAMGLMALLPVLALYVEERFGIVDPVEAAFWASIIYGAGPFAAACMGPIWGAMGDRYGKKGMAVRANLAIAVSMSLMPFADAPVWLLALRILQGLFAGYVAPAMSLVTAHLPRYVHGRIIARLQVAMALGMFAGPYIGAEISSLFGRASLFWFAAALSLLSGLRLWWAADESVPPARRAAAAEAAVVRRQQSFFAGFVGGVRSLLGQRLIGVLLVLLILLRLGQNMLEPMLSLFLRELGPQSLLLSISATETLALDRTIAVAFGVLAIAQWICTPWWGRMADRHGPLRCLVGLGFGLFAFQAATALVQTVNQFLLLRCGVACMMAGSMTLAYASVSKRVADEHRTLAFALVQSCIQLGLAFGPLLGALVAGGESGQLDFRFAFLVAALLCFAAATGMVFVRRLEARPVDRATSCAP
ncbi:MAG: MFS transporter [Planctomycetota bacterium]